MASKKFKSLVHYVVASCDDPQRLGATRLNKICWYVDTLAYRYHGESITGETYVRRNFGPVPKAILPTIRELQGEDKIHVRDHYYLREKKMRIFVALKDADPSEFETGEREIIDFVVQHVCHHHTAASISELSHDAVWDAANEGEVIPLSATLVAAPALLTDKISTWATGVIQKVPAKINAA